MYKLFSFATSINCLSEFSSKTAPVGLLGLIRQIATVLDVIFDFISAISGVEFSRSTENSMGIPPRNLM